MPPTVYKRFCKFCGADVSVELDPEFIKNLDFYLASACCDRCGDFKRSLSLLREACYKAAIDWHREKPNQPKIREKLEQLTRSIVARINMHHRVNAEWTPEFASEILRQPNHTDAIVHAFERQAKTK